MTLAKAIEILKAQPDSDELYSDPDFMDAIKLGIEALRRLQELRTPSSGNPHLTLPGETED